MKHGRSVPLIPFVVTFVLTVMIGIHFGWRAAAMSFMASASAAAWERVR